jgi:hypothetical protein
MTAAGGEVDFKYDHSVYWPALAKMGAERKQQRRERWEKAGKPIGESEVYLWGGAESSIAAAQTGTVENLAKEKTEAVGGAGELVDGVANLDIKTSEPIKTAV